MCSHKTFVVVVTNVTRTMVAFIAGTTMGSTTVDTFSVKVATGIAVVAFVDIVAANVNCCSDSTGSEEAIVAGAVVVAGKVETVGIVVACVII